MSYVFTKPQRHIKKVFIHCSASDNPKHDKASVIAQWHKARGWKGIGYHYFIRKNGKLEIGRSLEKIPAAQAGHNKGSLAICLHGLTKEKFTRAQFKTLVDLCEQINKQCVVTFHGHCEVSSKSCPVFDYKEVLGLDERGRMATEKPAPKPNRTAETGAGAVIVGGGVLAAERASKGDINTALAIACAAIAVAIIAFVVIKRGKS